MMEIELNVLSVTIQSQELVVKNWHQLQNTLMISLGEPAKLATLIFEIC